MKQKSDKNYSSEGKDDNYNAALVCLQYHFLKTQGFQCVLLLLFFDEQLEELFTTSKSLGCEGS